VRGRRQRAVAYASGTGVGWPLHVPVSVAPDALMLPSRQRRIVSSTGPVTMIVGSTSTTRRTEAMAGRAAAASGALAVTVRDGSRRSSRPPVSRNSSACPARRSAARPAERRRRVLLGNPVQSKRRRVCGHRDSCGRPCSRWPPTCCLARAGWPRCCAPEPPGCRSRPSAAAGHRCGERDHPRPPAAAGHPPGQALPVPRLLERPRRLPGPPPDPPGGRRAHLAGQLLPGVQVPPPDRHPSVGLETHRQPRRHHHRHQPRRPCPAQPLTTRPGRMTDATGSGQRRPGSGHRGWLSGWVSWSRTRTRGCRR
jgi:hypothetical protein